MFKQEIDNLPLLEGSSVTEFDSANSDLQQLINQQLMSNFDVANFDINSPNESEEYGNIPGQHDENTADVATYYVVPFQPTSPRGPPERQDLAGDLEFQVEINGSDTHKLKYLYSHTLNRIYVDMKIDFPVQFRWNPNCAPQPLYVRATVVFSDDSQAEKRVERCTQHTYDAGNDSLAQEIVKNVLRSSREMNTRGVYYCGVVSEADSWYSVLVELPPNGLVTHAYQFVCKNSCSTGINRRATDIIFTLEDSTGRVYGRQTVGVRVCSCPRRDKKHDEDGTKGGKRRVTPQQPQQPQQPRPKRAKVEDDDKVFELPPLQILGHRTVVTGLEVMLNMMEQAQSLRRADPHVAETYNKCIQELKKYIDEKKQ